MSGIYIPNMKMPEPGEAITVFCTGDVHRFTIGIRDVIQKSKAIAIPDRGRMMDVAGLVEDMTAQLNNLKKEYLSICDGDCSGDTSTGIPPCPFHEFPDIDKEGKMYGGRCRLKEGNDTKPHRCDLCKYYEGVHDCQGHAPCNLRKIGFVIWNDQCPRWEAVQEEKHD